MNPVQFTPENSMGDLTALDVLESSGLGEADRLSVRTCYRTESQIRGDFRKTLILRTPIVAVVSMNS